VGELGQVPTVRYGLSADDMSNDAKGESHHYDVSVTWFHHVELHKLQPSTRYYWQVTSPYNESSPILSFKTAPKVGEEKPFRFMANGDMGIDNSDNTVRRMKAMARNVDFFWHIGDLNYADDWQAYNTPYTYEEITEAWMYNMTDIWNETPYMTLPGNHETSCSENNQTLCSFGQLNFTSYRERFHMPITQSGAPAGSMFYSFDYGLVHFINMDTEVDYPDSPEGPGSFLNSGPFGDQRAWLEADLKKAVANRDNVPFIFMAGHHPWYASDCPNTDGSCWPAAQAFFEPFILKYGVDMIILGHIHYYDRMWPIGKNGVVKQHDYINPSDPVYLISASPGNIEGLTPAKQNHNVSAFLDTTHYGFTVFTVLNRTAIHWQFIDSDSGKVLDECTLIKEHRKNMQLDEQVEELLASQ